MSAPGSKLPPPKQSAMPRRINSSGRSTPIRASRESLVSNPPEDPRNPPGDNWIIGDTCYVNGTKLGKVAFLGETRFAPGQWAGVALEEPQGKNDGQVAGHRYFQCTANHGIFCRITKLTRTASEAGAGGDTTLTNLLPNAQSTPNSREPYLVERASAEKEFSPMDVSIVSSAPLNDVTLNPNNIQLNDRVVVSGSKMGVLRFLGETDFAAGFWAGVELEQPLGKNDGSVQNKRYFACKPRFGLFAPASKVVKAVSQSTSKKIMPVRHTKTSQMRLHRSGSQESLSSMSSFTSFASTSTAARAKPGDRGRQFSALESPTSPRVSATPLNQKRTHHHGLQKTASGSNTAAVGVLQESIKEKEMHVEQLLKESEIERAEMARASQQCELAEQRFAEYKRQSENEYSELMARVQHLEQCLKEVETEKSELVNNLDEEKRKSEDYQFQLEEATILKSDLETRVAELESSQGQVQGSSESKSQDNSGPAVQELQKKIEILQNKCSSQEKHVQEARSCEADLRHKLLQIETCRENEMKASEAKIGAMVKEIEQLKSDFKLKEGEIQSLSVSIEEHTKRENESKNLCLRLDSNLKELMAQNSEEEHKLSDIRKKYTELEKEKQNLESQLAQKSGATNEQMELISSKNKELENLKTELSKNQGLLKGKESELNLAKERGKELAAKLVKVSDENSETVKKLETEISSEKDGLRDFEEKQKLLVEQFAQKEKELIEKNGKEVQSLNESISQTKADLEKSLQQISSLNEVQTKSEAEKENLRAEIEGLKQAQTMAADALAKQLVDEKNRLEAECTTLRGGFEQKDKDVKRKEEKIEELSKDLENKVSLCAKLETEKVKALSKVEENSTIIENLNKELEKGLAASKMRVQGFNEERKELERELQVLKEENGKGQTKIGELEKLLQDSQSSTKKFENESQEHLKNVAVFETKLKNVEEEKCRIENEMKLVKEEQAMSADAAAKQMNEEKNRLLEELKLAHEKMGTLETDLTSLKFEKESLEKNHQENIEKIKQMNEEKTELVRALEVVKCSENGLQKEKQELQSKLDSLHQELSENAAKLQSVDLELKNSGDLVAKLKDETQESGKQVAVFETNLKSSEEEKTRLEAEIQGLKEAQAMNADAAAKQMNEEKERLSEELKIAHDKIGAVESEIASLKHDHEAVIKKNAEAEDRNKRIENEKSAVVKDLEDAKNSLNATELEKHGLESKLDAMKQEFSATAEKLVAVESSLQNSSELVEKLKVELQESGKQSAVFETQLKSSEEEKSRLEIEIQSLKDTQTLNADAATKHMNEEKNRLSEEIKVTHEKIAAFEAEMTALKLDKESCEKTNQESLEKMKIVEIEKEELSKSLGQIKAAFETSQNENDDLKSKLEGFSQESATSDEKLEALEAELLAAQEKLKVVESNKVEEVSKQQVVLKEFEMKEKKLRTELSESVNLLALCKTDFEKQLEFISKERSEAKEQIARFNAEASASSSQNSAKVNELEQHIQELKQNWETSKDFEKQLSLSQCTIAELKQLHVLKDSENSKLKVELDKLQNVVNKLQEVECANAKLEQDLADAKRSQNDLTTEFDCERSKYQLQISETTEKLKQTQSLLENTNKQLTGSTDNDLLVVKQLEDDKLVLADKIAALETKLVNAQQKQSAAPAAPSVGREAELESQVTFLNSIIVDQRRKQEEMQQKIEVLMRTPIDSMAQVKKVPAPRVYCDICEEFDLHDTDDCPTQASDEQDLANHSHHHAKGKPTRPYCDNCEEFGHETENCDNEMF